MDIPEGFEPYQASAFASTFGPVFESRLGAVPVLGVRAMHGHANSMGRVHGGLLLALADTALGNFVKSLVSEHALALTVDLNVSFMVGALLGQWIEVRPSLERKGRSMVFVSGTIHADETMIARVSATFFVHHRSGVDQREFT